MVAKIRACLLVFTCVWFSSYALKQVGLIIKKGDEAVASIVDEVLKNKQGDDAIRTSSIRILKEVLEKEDAASYHRAFCRLLAQGIVALLSPATEPNYSILADYSRAYQIPFITTNLPEVVGVSSNIYSIGMQPSTTRALLSLFQLYGWKDVVYLYDHDNGPEKLQMIFLLGYRVLNLTLDGIMKVASAEEANWYLQMLDKSYDNKIFHVILDTDPNLTRDIIWRHVNDINLRKKNFYFVLAQPTPDHFWSSDKAAFGAINATAFIITNQLHEKEISSMQTWISKPEHQFNILSYYYHDAALVLLQMIGRLMHSNSQLRQANTSLERRDCLSNSPSPIIDSATLFDAIKGTNIQNGVTGRIHFRNGLRNFFDLNITQITSRGNRKIGTWSNGVLRPDISTGKDIPITLPLIQDGKLRIVTKISSPYMMWKKSENGSDYNGNDRFEGYLKDLIDLLAQNLEIEYDLKLVEDDQHGEFEAENGKWTGIIGEIIQGKADLAVADLAITAQRQRVVDFTDPYEMAGFSLVMKNPLSISPTSSMFFFLTAFSADVWICILLLVVIFGILFHVITKFTGAPDSIESASGIWGRKHTIIVNTWFSLGSSMLHGTGVYPRSISSRVLSGVFWLFTLILSSLFIASIAAQILTNKQSGRNNPRLSQLQDLSLESIIFEAVSKGWPKVGLLYPSNTELFIKKSKLPTFMKYAEYLKQNPDVKVETVKEGLRKVRESAGDYMILLESLTSEYEVRQKPCDIIATHDSVPYTGYGLATALGSELSLQVNDALHAIINNGTLGSLHQKWWISTSECNLPNEENNERTIHVFTGLLCVSAVGFLILFTIFGVQYIRKNQNKESRRQQLSFEDMNLGQTLPQPPPELLAEPAPVLNLPEYDRKTLL